VLARGGVYVAGGIAPRIISRLREGGFLAAFNAKGAQANTMRKTPLSVVNHDRLGLLGCALIAGRLRA
jgi:glucokinase